jgi:hypothetical protein
MRQLVNSNLSHLAKVLGSFLVNSSQLESTRVNSSQLESTRELESIDVVLEFAQTP